MKTIAMAAVLLGSMAMARAEAPGLPYTEGSVWQIQTVRVHSGFDDEYLRSLSSVTKKILDEAKKQKLILSYKIINAGTGGPEDWNYMILVELKNMAALDGLHEKMHTIAMGVLGGQEGAHQLASKRIEIREGLGDKVGRELILK
jgi:hypothetical protein